MLRDIRIAGMLQIQDLRLYEELSKRAKQRPKTLIMLGQLKALEGHANTFLEFVRHSCPSYTDHSLQHSLRVLSNLGDIIDEDLMEDLTSVEIYCLIMSSIFHDCGMISENKDSLRIREEHHLTAAGPIEKYVDKFLIGTISDPTRFVRCISFIVESHGLDWHDMESRLDFRTNQTFFQERVRTKLLCVLLRIGDLLDMDGNRTCAVTRHLFPGFFENETSQSHHARHCNLQIFSLGPDQIVAHAEAPDKQQHKIWKKWFEYLRDEIYLANTHILRGDLANFRLPEPDLDIIVPPNASYELWSLRFELDENGRIFELISQSIYTGINDFVRELIQNSIDACLKRIYQNSDGVCPDVATRRWHMPDYQPCIAVLLDQDSNSLWIIDNGVGMTKDQLESFLFKVAASGDAPTEAARDFSFPGIAMFGIGFVSALSRADEIKIFTRSRLDKPYCVSIHTGDLEAYVDIACCAEGTAIKLNLKHSNHVMDIEKYLRLTFSYPSVAIRFIDLKAANSSIDSFFHDHPNVFDTSKHVRIGRENATAPDLPGTFRSIDDACGVLLESVRSEGLDRSDIDTIENLVAEFRSSHFTIQNSSPTDTVTDQIGSFLVKFGEDLQLPTIKDYTNEIDLLFTTGDGIDVCWFPLVVDEPRIGIEWRSYHGVLIFRNRMTLYVDSLETNAKTNEDVDELDFEKKLAALQSRGIAPGSLSVKNDSIVASDGHNNIAHLDSPFSSTLDHDGGETDFPLTLFDLERELMTLDNSVYQDGIRVPIEAWEICPLGACRATANFMGPARFALNVSRNAIDEDPVLVRNWTKDVANVIHTAAVERLARIANALECWVVGGSLVPTPIGDRSEIYKSTGNSLIRAMRQINER